MRYKCKYFDIQELVNPKIFNKYGETSWKMLNEDLLVVADFIKEEVKDTVYINTYKWGGGFVDSGIRVDFGSSLSPHRYGQALDLKFKNTPVNDVYDFIMSNQQLFYQIGLRRIESLDYTTKNGTEWLHIDTVDKEGYENKIYTFIP